MVCLLLALAGAGCGSGIGDLSGYEAATAPSTVFPVSQFGAKGDGIADDAPAIQRALSAAAAAGGGQVTFACGNFWIASVAGSAPAKRSLLYLNASSGVQVVGQGRCTHLFTAAPQKTVLEFEDSTGMSVTNIRITALNAQYVETYGLDGGAAIRFSGGSHGSITKVEVDGATAGALYLTKGVTNSVVAGNYIHDTYGAGIWEDDCGGASATSCAPSSPPHNNVYDSNTLTNTSMMMLSAITLDDGGGSSNAIVKNNKVSWTHPALPANPQVHCIQVGNTADVTILNNTCTGTPWDAIAVTTANGAKSQRITIQGNVLNSSGSQGPGGSGIVIFDDPKGGGISGITINYNNIAVSMVDGIRVYSASGAGHVRNVQVTHNTVSMVDQRAPGTRFGIDVEFSANVTISGNTISCNGKCIAAGVNINSSTGVAPTAAANQVSDIEGQALEIH